MFALLIASLLSIVLSLVFAIWGFSFVDLPISSDIHFGLMTVNSIFAGFLFTNYSLLLDFVTSENAQKLSGTDIFEKRNRHIKGGIVCSIFSTLCGLFQVFKYKQEIVNAVNVHIPWLHQSVYLSEIIFAITSIYFFAVSMYEMHLLTKPYFSALKKPATDMKVVKNEYSELTKALNQAEINSENE